MYLTVNKNLIVQIYPEDQMVKAAKYSHGNIKIWHLINGQEDARVIK
jgi:hypothetical protein